jgi:ribonuclease-3
MKKKMIQNNFSKEFKNILIYSLFLLSKMSKKQIPTSSKISGQSLTSVQSLTYVQNSPINEIGIAQAASGPKYSIYNPNNKLIGRKEIVEILHRARLNNRPQNYELWQEAFVHTSYTLSFKPKNADSIEYENVIKNKPEDLIALQEKSNERLEWLGDGIIQSVIASYLWKRYPTEDEGFLTKTRSKLVRTETLAKLAEILGLNQYILMSEYMETFSNGRNNPRILEDTYEAFVGAMYLDFGRSDEIRGYAVCREFIINCFEDNVNIDEIASRDDNYKDRLMRFYQKEFNGKFPLYYEFPDSNQPNITPGQGPNVTRSFHVYVMDPDNVKRVGEGRAKTKKEAEQMAALNALKHYKQYSE